MMHRGRRWSVHDGLEHDEIAAHLDRQCLRPCAAFKTAAGTVWANDSTSPDALQEYVVLRADDAPGVWRQVESITISWCDEPRLRMYLEAADKGTFDAATFDKVDEGQLEDDHTPCPHCR